MRKIILIFQISLFFNIVSAGPYPEKVIEFNRGKDYNPDFQDLSKVLGPPEALSSLGLAGSLDVLNLGFGGSIILSYESTPIYNGDGVDFAIFENPFYINGSFSQIFLEPAYVFVSSDGDSWTSFTSQYLLQNPVLLYDNNPEHYKNFAGIMPVFSSTANDISPLNPSTSGGDWFDLENIKDSAIRDNVDINNIKYIKIVDVEPHIGKDSFGNIIPGAFMPTGLNGFDLDAVAARYTHSPITSAKNSLWEIYE